MGIINFAKPETGNFLVDIILWLVSITSSVAAGVILFTVILKLITLPFDYASRASMRKNSLKMEEMRPELEKLQKQYADNKDLYNQKMMALYKKNGYSMFGACLPTILTLVIFIVALNGFNSYSQFQNRQYFYNMSLSYNGVLYSGLDIDNNYIVKNDDGTILVKDKELFELIPEGENSKTVSVNESVNITVTKDDSSIYVETTNGYVKYQRKYTITDGNVSFADVTYTVTEVKNDNLACAENNNLTVKRTVDGNEVSYSFDDAVNIFYNTKNEEYKTQNNLEDYKSGDYSKDFLRDIAQEKSAERYREENARFLWVKNIWVTDSPMKHPVESSWSTFKSTHGYSGYDIGDADYENLIAKLEYEQNAPNGYFILVLLTAGVSFLMQLVTAKSQKAQMELQTVDGQGAQTQKIMKWIMPIMMAIFAFMYTAAFSIYIILSSLISIGTTFGINFIVDKKMKKQKNDKEKDVIRGRVYVPKEEPKEEPKKEKNKKDDKFAHEKGEDFLSGKADKKHIRGRIK